MLGPIFRQAFASQVLVTALVAALTGQALAAEPAPATAAEKVDRVDPAASAEAAYALVVGSNAGGDGQQDLRYAERDAGRLADVLREVGGYPAENVVVVLRPDRGRLLAAVAALRARLQQHAGRGQQTRLFFYYSGHARAHALSIGRDEVTLSELRQALLELPSTLTVVVIDACQSGAFSRIKGAELTADFSFNSVARLNTAGVAVMASSSATELSQESDQLAASFFTHNLVVALRGAGDANQDGRVTLDEAYRYTYHRTLTGTAATSVGAQHATLETELKGKGDVVLTRPAAAAATAALVFPAAVEGRVLLSQRRGDTVLAELDKARGKAVLLALAPGGYTALVRQGQELRECDITLPAQTVVTLDLRSCRPSSLEIAGAKGAAPWDGPLWGLELSLGLISSRKDAYVQEIQQFDFSDSGGLIHASTHLSLTGSRRLGRYLALTLALMDLDGQSFHRDRSAERGGADARFSWSSYALAAGVRAMYPLLDGHFVPFAQGSVGPALAFTHWDDDTGTVTDTFGGYQVGVVGGFLVMPRPRVGLLFQVGTTFAPIIENRFGETHDSGGVLAQMGFRVGY